MKRIINKIRLLFKSLNVISNINELVVKMHKIEDNNIYLDKRLRKLTTRIDDNFDKLEDKIEEEGKLFDSLEAMQGVNKTSIETLSRGLELVMMDIKDKITKLEDKILIQAFGSIKDLECRVKTLEEYPIKAYTKIDDLERRTKASLIEVSLIIKDELDKNINLSNKGDK